MSFAEATEEAETRAAARVSDAGRSGRHCGGGLQSLGSSRNRRNEQRSRPAKPARRPACSPQCRLPPRSQASPAGSARPTSSSPNGRKQRDDAEEAEAASPAGPRGAARQDSDGDAPQGLRRPAGIDDAAPAARTGTRREASRPAGARGRQSRPQNGNSSRPARSWLMLSARTPQPLSPRTCASVKTAPSASSLSLRSRITPPLPTLTEAQAGRRLSRRATAPGADRLSEGGPGGREQPTAPSTTHANR